MVLERSCFREIHSRAWCTKSSEDRQKGFLYTTAGGLVVCVNSVFLEQCGVAARSRLESSLWYLRSFELAEMHKGGDMRAWFPAHVDFGVKAKDTIELCSHDLLQTCCSWEQEKAFSNICPKALAL
jgi:hypothetical protein